MFTFLEDVHFEWSRSSERKLLISSRWNSDIFKVNKLSVKLVGVQRATRFPSSCNTFERILHHRIEIGTCPQNVPKFPTGLNYLKARYALQGSNLRCIVIKRTEYLEPFDEVTAR